MDVEPQVSARGCYTRQVDVYNALRASRQCCNTPTRGTLHAVTFMHRYMGIYGNIWQYIDLPLSDAGLTVTAFI